MPVFNRPILSPKFAKVFARPIAGASPILPAGFISKPMLMCAFRNVPVVITTVFEFILVPSSRIIPVHFKGDGCVALSAFVSIIKSSTGATSRSRLGVLWKSSFCMCFLYRSRSICAR